MKNRKPNRLKNYDYSNNGMYFITTCVKNSESFFGYIADEKMILNEYGKIINECWYDLPNHYKNCVLDAFIIMPNHIHGIIVIESVGNGFKPFPTALPEIVRGFKTFSSRRINEFLEDGVFRWQKSYYDRIIRDENELLNIRNYIINNPLRWNRDLENEVNDLGSKDYYDKIFKDAVE